MTVSVVIPTIPGREEMLERAVASVMSQTHRDFRVWVELDEHRTGAAATRNRALASISAPFVAFLDDDDVLKPNHLRACIRHMCMTAADVVYPYYDTIGEDPIKCFGLPFSGELLQKSNYIPVTTLCRTDKVRAAGGFQDHPDANGDPCEDWGLWLAMHAMGAKFSHLPQRTWIWTVDGGTRGRGDW